METSRIDALQKVTGKAKYIEDLPDLPGTVYAATARSPYSHARILSVDSSRAEQKPGVLGVFHRDHLGELTAHVKAGHECFVAIDKVRFDGEQIAVVVAADLRTARIAAESIKIDYEVLPSVFNAAEALAPGAPLIHEPLGSNLAHEDSLEWGDVEKGFKEADRTFEETFYCPSMVHHPIEPANSFLVHWGNQSLDIWVPTNTPSRLASELSEFYGIPPEKVRVQVPYVGGAFGNKDKLETIIATVALSRKIGRPIKFVATGYENFRVAARAGMEFRTKIGVQSDGTLTAMDVNILVDAGAYFSGATNTVTRSATTSSWGGYRMPHFRLRSSAVFTNKVSAWYFRNTGKNETAFAVECTVDNVARRMGMDPIEFREKNVLRRGERVTERWRFRGVEAVTDTPLLDADLTVMMQRATEAMQWKDKDASNKTTVSDGSRVARGRGIALFLRRGSTPWGSASAMASLGSDGKVTIFHNAAELGMGTHTMISIVASKTLGIPQSQVEVGMPDTSNNLPFAGVNSQRTTVQMGKAVQEACEVLRGEILLAAVKTKGGRLEEWRVKDGRVRRREESFSLRDIARFSSGNSPLKGHGSNTFATTSQDKAYGGRFNYWAPGAAAVEVEVDLETGEIRVLEYAAVADAGKALHYPSVKGQVEGGAIMGFGMALFVELRYEDGQLQNADAFQYRLPLLPDIPESFRVAILENGDGPGPFGAKGIAQTSIACTSPAIGNAICDAIGERIRSIPYTPEKILRALGKLG